MLVILLENINKIGKKNDIKNVNDGYASNFLIPRKLAIIATPELIEKTKKTQIAQEKKKEETHKEAENQAKEIEGKRFILKVKTGEEGQLFEAVHPEAIAEKINQNGFSIKADQLIIDEPIKKLGEFKVKIKFEPKIEATINLVIDKENK